MLSQRLNRCARSLVCVVLLVAVTGCSKEEEPKATGPAADVKELATSVLENKAEMEAKLAQADELDGKADKIIVRCASCALKMDGKSDHSLKVLDYTLHFCTQGCLDQFAKDTTKSVLAMKIPAE